MSKKSLRSLIMFFALLALGAWYFQDTRTPEQKAGQVAIEPGQNTAN